MNCSTRTFRGLILAVMACAASHTSPSRAWSDELTNSIPKFTATFDGKAISPHIEHASGVGDQATYVLHLDVAMTLQSEREMNFTKRGESENQIFVSLPDQTPRLVAVTVGKTYHDDKEVLLNPLATLSDAEIRGLWGIEINHWSDEIAQKLKLIDPARTCVTIREDTAQGRKHALPPLPAGLTKLRIQSNSSEGLKNLDELRDQTELRFLSISMTGAASFDCSLIKQAIHLETLNLIGNTLKSTDDLAALTQLKVLIADYCRGLNKISFASAMPKLTTLRISNTQVVDLSPLEGLSMLQTVDANLTPVRKLPASIPALRELNVISSRLTDADVNTFQQANQECRVRHRWGASLQTALKSATRLRIRSGGTCHRNEATEKTLFETNAADQIQQLLAGIQLNEARSGFHCMCCGDPSLEFYEGDRLIVTLGFHHGEGFRWTGGWPGDAALTPQSADFLVEWLANHDVTGPLKQRQAKAEEVKAGERKIAQATVAMSPSLAAVFRKSPQTFAAALKKELPDKGARVEVLLRVFGTSNDSWSQLEDIERLADEQLRTYDAEILGAAIEKALLGNDRQLRRGAARFWESWQSPLEKWNPQNVAQLHRIVLLIQQEARYYPLRMEALDNLRSWKSDVSEDEFARRLSAGLHDSIPQVRRKAMLIAGRTRHEPSATDLMSVLRGKTLTTQPFPDVPAAEAQDPPEGFGDVAEGCSDVEVAALALAYMEHAATKPVIDAIQPRTPLLEVALALLGEGSLLKPEHFAAPHRNQELQLAAVEAVIRSKGKFGLQDSFGYKQATHWWEVERVSQRLSQMLQTEKAPSSDELAGCKDLKTLQQWFRAHGAEYLKRFDTSK